jgi:hypothetical protein
MAGFTNQTKILTLITSNELAALTDDTNGTTINSTVLDGLISWASYSMESILRIVHTDLDPATYVITTYIVLEEWCTQLVIDAARARHNGRLPGPEHASFKWCEKVVRGEAVLGA